MKDIDKPKIKPKISFFPQDPEVIGECDCCCEKTKDITFDPCEQFKDISVDNVALKCQGRLLKVDVELDRVYTGKDIEIGVLVCCSKDCDNSMIKGFRSHKLYIKPDSLLGQCRNDYVDNVTVGPFCFVISDEDLYQKKDLRVHVIAHYTNLGQCPCE